MKFKVGDRVRLTEAAEADPENEGMFVPGAVGVVAVYWSHGGLYDVTFFDSPGSDVWGVFRADELVKAED